MKKVYLTLFLLVLSAWSFAQKNNAKFHSYEGKPCFAEGNPFATLKAQSSLDSLDFHVDRASGFTIPGVQAGGYLFGVSNDGQGASITDATAMYFDAVGTANVSEVFVWVGAKHIIGSPNILKCEVWNAGADSLPTNLLGYGEANMGFVDSATSVNFGTGLGLNRFFIDIGTNTVTSTFLVSVNYQSFDDTLGMVSNNAGDGFGERRAKQMFGVNFGGGWTSAADIWTSGADQDPIIIPVMEFTGPIGTEPTLVKGEHLSLMPAWPNPANQETGFSFSLAEPSKTRISLWDATGRLAFDSGVNEFSSGEHHYTFDLSALPSGQYYYTILTEKTSLTSKISVQH